MSLLNRPPESALSPPSPRVPLRSNIPGLDTSTANRICISGQWTPIRAGSLRELRGVAFRRDYEILPLMTFTTPEGEQAAVIAADIQGWAPITVPGVD
jgi:hypothetical protein